MNQVEQVWDPLFPADLQRLVRLLVEKVIVTVITPELRRLQCVNIVFPMTARLIATAGTPQDRLSPRR